MKRIKKTSLFILILFLVCPNEVTPTIIIPSILMAMSGGIIMSKMTLGGLMMMLMAANQQQKGQNILRNLGSIPHQEGLSVPTGSTSAAENTQAQNVGIEELIVRRKRDITDNSSTIIDKLFSSNSTSGNNTSNQRPKIDLQVQYRIMRQVAANDPLSCLPQALCGISATPPSTQSGFLNDYAYLLKQVFTRDEDIDDLDNQEDNEELEEFNKLKYNGKKKKGSKGSGNKLVVKSETSKKSNPYTKKKKGSNRNDESSEEYEVPLNDEELERLMMKEAYEVESLANEELVDEEPDFFQYAVRDSASGGTKLGPYAPPRRPQDVLPPDEEEELVGIAPSDLHKMSESELDTMLAKINRNAHHPGLYRGGPVPGSNRPPPQQKEQAAPSTSSNSLWSSMIPKLSMGFSPGQGQNFGDDPFFSGFKRSIDNDDGQTGQSANFKVRAATLEEEQMFKEMIQRRRQRLEFINLKRKELTEIQDPVEKFRIAAEFGEKTKSPRQCRVLFNNCPFTYHQVLEMISGLRKALTGQPLTEPVKDTVVELKPTSTTTAAPPPPPPPPPPPAPPAPAVTKNIINVNSGRDSIGGVTSILHELPTGERVEINLKMTKSGLSQTKTTSQKTRPKIRYTTTAKPPLISMLSKNKKKPLDVEDLFDDEDEKVASAPSTDKTVGTLTSLESLRATMLAIQKINNVTVQRKKEGKPISFSHVYADLKQSSSEIKKRPQQIHKRPAEPEEFILPEPDPEFLTKLQAQNLRPKAKRPRPVAQKTASALLASSLVKIEDDEVEVDLPELRPVKGTNIRVKRPPFPPKNKFANVTVSKTNQELTQILEGLRAKAKNKGNKTTTTTTTSKKTSSQKQKEAEDTPEDENEEEDATDEEDEDEEEDDVDYNNPNLEIEEEEEEEEEDDLGRSGIKVPKGPIVDPEDMILVPVPEQEEDTSAGRIQSTQTFTRRQSPPIESNSSNKRQKRRHRKPKKLFPNESTEFIRLIPL